MKVKAGRESIKAKASILFDDLCENSLFIYIVTAILYDNQVFRLIDVPLCNSVMLKIFSELFVSVNRTQTVPTIDKALSKGVKYSGFTTIFL